MSNKNNPTDPVHRSDDYKKHSRGHARDFYKTIEELTKKNEKLFSDFRLMRDKLKLNDQTTEIQFQLLRKELEESKVESGKRNRLFISLFHELRPDFKTLSSAEEILSRLTMEAQDRDNIMLQQQKHHHLEHQPQPCHLQHTQHQQLLENPHNEAEQQTCQQQQQLKERLHQQPQKQQECCLVVEEQQHNHRKNDDDHLKIKHEMIQIQELLKILKEEVEDLKRREQHGASLTVQIEESSKHDEERGGQLREDILASFRKEEEASEHHFLPSDTYSYFAVGDYFSKRRDCMVPATAFSIACSTLIIQLATLSIFIMDVVDYKNATNPISVPPGVSIQVRVSQLIALLISCWNQDEVRASFNVLSIGYRKEKVRAINCNATWHKWHFSIFVRIVVGWFSLIVTFILIVNSDTVRDVMLDFAAVTFVSELDNGVFQLSLWGYMGHELRDVATKIRDMPVYEKRSSSSERTSWRMRKVPRLVWLFMVMSLMIGFWTWITSKQERGYYLDQSIFVQFGDDFSPAIGAFSGVYEIELDDTIDGMRVNYVERGEKSDGRFSYCSQDKRWLFQYGSEPDGYIERLFSECWHRARSSETESYDLVKTSDITWFVLEEGPSLLENPLQHFLVKGQNNYYGKPCKNDEICGDRMHCDDNEKRCVCLDGLFGINCEFPMPCETLEIDSRDANGFFGTRSWSRRYSSLSQAGRVGDKNNTSPIQVYGKPIYVGDESIEGIFDVMIFTGRRWILTDSVSIRDYKGTSNDMISINENDDDNDNTFNAKRHLAEFLANDFHAYWSNYTFQFASEPVDIGTPTDSATPVGLQWFRLETTGTQGASLHSGEQIWKGRMNIDAKLFCAVCNNETNPCFYGATCQTDGTCDCTTGSSGRICQIPPDNNGNCDVFFNTPEFGFDGGDCCVESCRSTEENACGRGVIEEMGVAAIGFVGYPNCEDPRFKYKLSGSKTLYDIVDRGFVRCGSKQHPGFFEISDGGHHSGFELDLCKAIAAAILNDPEAVEIVESTEVDRWIDLAADKFDVLLLRSTYTAERDIFERNARVGFSFVPISTFFDGLRYRGIPPYTECADILDFESPECIDLKICVARRTTWHATTEKLFPFSVLVEVESMQEMVDGLEAGICNVIAGDVSTFPDVSAVRAWGFTGPLYSVGNNIYSKDPLAAVTRQDDRVFYKFVSWIFEALIQAEESGITKSTSDNIAPTDAFGERFQNMFQNAVAANGNYGEIYEKNLLDKIPRSGLNTVNTGGSGLIYSFPFGAISTRGPDPIVGGAIDTVRKRGILNCGISKGAGFAELDAITGTWKGFEVDLCRGVAAAIFHGSPNMNFIPLSNTERFVALADGVVDILTFASTHTLSREVNEATTGQGFDFTPTIFYDGLGFGGRPPYIGCAEFLVFIDTDCRDTRICVPDGTTWLDALTGPLNIPEFNIVVTISMEESYRKFIAGECNVIAGESSQIAESTLREFGLPAEDNEYVVGVNKFTKEPLAAVSRSDDTQFSDFLRWIIYGFFYAEEAGINREDYYEMPVNNYLFGNGLSGMWQHSIQAVGNYGEIFARNFEGILERGGQNNVNDKNGPQFYAKPGVTFKQNSRTSGRTGAR